MKHTQLPINRQSLVTFSNLILKLCFPMLFLVLETSRISKVNGTGEQIIRRQKEAVGGRNSWGKSSEGRGQGVKL